MKTLQIYVQSHVTNSFEIYERNFLKHPLSSLSIVLSTKKNNKNINQRITAKGKY